MRMYQPVDFVKGVLKENEVFHYLENAKAHSPNSRIAVFEEGEIENPIFLDKIKTRIRLVHDSSPMNPWKDWDCELPLMYYGGRNSMNEDYSNGDIDEYLMDKLREEGPSIDELLDMIDSSRYDFDDEEPDIEEVYDDVDIWIRDSLDNRATLAEHVGVKHLLSSVTGYSQGDYIEVFICWTPQFGEQSGLEHDKLTTKMMEGSVELFGQWAFGDVYGFIVEEKETDEVLDSCFGFYGDDWENNGMMDYIMDCIEDKTKEEVLEILKDLDVEY